MKNHIPPPLAFQALNEIGIIEQLSRHQLERQLPDNLKVSQFSVLNHLVRLGGEWNPLRLARAFQVTKGAMTNTLKRLESRGLVIVSADPSDGRGKLVAITPAGQKTHGNCITDLGPLLASISSEITDEEFTAILPTLKKIRKYLDENRS